MAGIREPEITVKEKSVDPAERVFIKGDDKNIVATVIYTADGEAFTYDTKGEIAVPAADMFDLFIKGVVAVKNNVYYKPVSCTKEGVIAFGFPSVP